MTEGNLDNESGNGEAAVEADTESESDPEEDAYTVVAECEEETMEKLSNEYGIKWCEGCCTRIRDAVEEWIKLVPPYLNFRKFCARHEFRKYDKKYFNKVVLQCKHSWPDWAR